MLLRVHLYTLFSVLFALMSIVTALPAECTVRLGEAWGESEFAKLWYRDQLKVSEELDVYVASLPVREREKLDVIEKVRDGRMSLVDAAVHFRYMNNLPNSSNYHGEADWPGLSENERLCRQVIRAVDCYSIGMPSSKRAAILERLETELRDNRAFYGTVTLPEESEVRF
jgi:hypothetical protein